MAPPQTTEMNMITKVKIDELKCLQGGWTWIDATISYRNTKLEHCKPSKRVEGLFRDHPTYGASYDFKYGDSGRCVKRGSGTWELLREATASALGRN